ncbi:MAG: elongation factor P, partial [Planctomycetota bacterium]
MKANDIKPGTALNLNGDLQIVTKAEHVKPGKGPAYVQAKIKSVATGAVTEKRFRTVEDVEQAILDRRKMQYLYSDASGQVFMDNETYDQITIPQELLGDSMLYIKENEDVDVLFYKGNPVSMDPPKAVNLAVTETTPQPKGAT